MHRYRIYTSGEVSGQFTLMALFLFRDSHWLAIGSVYFWSKVSSAASHVRGKSTKVNFPGKTIEPAPAGHVSHPSPTACPADDKRRNLFHDALNLGARALFINLPHARLFLIASLRRVFLGILQTLNGWCGGVRIIKKGTKLWGVRVIYMLDGGE